MRFFAVLLTMSVGLGCGGASGREARSADEENNEEVTEPQSEESAESESAAADEDSDERKANEGARPGKKRKPKRPRRQVEAAPQQELPPMYRKPLPPEPPPVEEPAPAPAANYEEATDQNGDTALEAEARKRCRWKNVAPYRPDWANSISPPLAQQRKITSKPICPYGTPPAVLRVARQIAVQQTKLRK